MKTMKTIFNSQRLKGFVCTLCLSLLVASTLTSRAQITVSGIVTDLKTGESLSGAHISDGDGTVRLFTDDQGRFTSNKFSIGHVVLTVTYVGYGKYVGEFTIIRDTTLLIGLEAVALLGNEVSIVATRAQDRYPAAYSYVTAREISALNTGKDIPTLIQGNPSTVVTSDAGNGVGYSSFSIRGTDLTRINVTVNSVPLNDPESQGVWFVDLPDLASSTENIQIQRGVGTSTNGAGAFGASVNFMTSDLRREPYGQIDLSGGSYNTWKQTYRFGTGLIANRLSLDGRLSLIHSDGYIDRASSDLKSYYISAGFYTKKTTVRFLTFSGFEKTYQAWEGVPEDSLNTNRTYNPAGQYTDKLGNISYYPNQTDNYRQFNYQLHFSQVVAKNWNLNATLHYTSGKGYYENFREDASFSDYNMTDPVIGNDTVGSGDLVNRKEMDNDFWGITFSGNYSKPEAWKATVGGAWNRYYGKHFGKVIWTEYDANGDEGNDWYYNTGIKTDFNIFIKANVTLIKKVSLFADLQYRHVNYGMNGSLDDLRNLDQQHRFDFFNPKAGIFYEPDRHNSLFFSFGVANREPSRNNYKDADPGRMPVNETLYDYELGYTCRLSWLTASANLYYMDYRDQLVLTGEINNVGEAVMVNVPESYRAGAEIAATAKFFKDRLIINMNATFSRNRIRDFTQYIDLYDQEWNRLGQDTLFLGETDLSFSPNIILNGGITYQPIPQLLFGLNAKYVGKQYIDNTSDAGRSLDGYLVGGANASWTLKTKTFGDIRLTVTVNNLFNARYETNAWVYPYNLGGRYGEYNGFFPQALINFLAGISFIF